MSRVSLRRLRSTFALLLVAISTMISFFACSDSERVEVPEDAGPTDSSGLADSSPADGGGAFEDASPDPRAPRCADSGFCTTPLPTLQPLVAIAASSIDDAWAITREEILRWDGKAWAVVHRSPGAELFAIAVGRANDVWVVGTNLIIRYSARDGGPGAATFREYPGSTPVTPYQTTGYWVSPDSSELWIHMETFFERRDLFRYREEFGDGGGSLVEKRMTDADMGFPWTGNREAFDVYSIFGFGPKDVYAGGLWCTDADCTPHSTAGRYGAIAHYDGTRWRLVSELEKQERVSAIYGITAPDRSRLLWIWAGVAGSETGTIRLLPSMPDGTVGPARQRLPIATQPGPFSTLESHLYGCHRVHGSIVDPNTAWFSNACLVYRWKGSLLERVPTALGHLPMGSVTGIWAGSTDDVWLVGATPSSVRDEAVGFAALRRGSP